MDPDGTAFWAVSDRGRLIRASVLRAQSGRILSIREERILPLQSPRGGFLSRFFDDSEGLTRVDNGFFVSFEGEHRIAYLENPEARTRPRPRDPRFERFGVNSGLEALATDANGRILAIPERSGGSKRPFPVFRWDGIDWEIPYRIPREGDFLPTGADLGPDGKLYLLERSFSFLGGFRIRIRRFVLGDQELLEPEVLLIGGSNAYDNAEGISLWRAPGGEIRLSIISDNNFQPLQRTILSEFRVQEAPSRD